MDEYIEDEQKFNLGKNFLSSKVINTKFALGMLCLSVIGQGMMVTGGLTISINSIERAFTYNSVESATIDTVYNVCFALGAIFISYFGDKRKTYWISLGIILLSLGSITFILPQFIYKNTGIQTDISKILCDGSSDLTPSCIRQTRLYLAIFCLGYAIIGFGSSPMHTLSVSYIDSITTHGNNGLYLGIFYLCSGLGPALTFLLSQPFLSIPVNLVLPENSHLTPDSETWVGAWWIIYIIGALLLACMCIPVLLLPQHFRDKNSAKPDKEKMKVTGFRNFYRNIMSLITNFPYMFLNLGVVLEGLSTSGLTIFFPKYLEAQFQLSSGNASLLAGVLTVIGATLGLLGGGGLIKRYKWHLKPLITFIMAASFVGAFLLSVFFLYCPTTFVVGVEVNSKSQITGFSSNCSKSCECSLQSYMPVCFNESITYFSPCIAGCSRIEGEVGSRSFHNCSCIPGYNTELSVVERSCKNKCNRLIPFMIVGLFTMFFVFFIFVPVLDFTLRVVEDGQQSFGLGFQQLKLRVAFIVSPLIYGHFIDKACHIFQNIGDCDGNSNCLEYDLKKFGIYIFAISFSLKFAAATCHLIIFIYYMCKKPKIEIPTIQDTGESKITESIAL